MSNDVTKDKLVADLKVVIADAEELLRATASQAGEKAGEARVRIQQSLRAAKDKLMQLEAVALEKTKQAARATDEYVHENPWKVIGISACVAVVIGILVSRR